MTSCFSLCNSPFLLRLLRVVRFYWRFDEIPVVKMLVTALIFQRPLCSTGLFTLLDEKCETIVVVAHIP